MKIPIVNKNDEIIEYKERGQESHEDIRRITHVWVFNKKKEFLIAKRQPAKKLSPNKWTSAVVGTLEEGETYESNAIKELEEEIGVRNIIPIFYKKLYYENFNGKRFCCIFIVHIEKEESEFVLQNEEVAEVRWMNLEELSDWYQQSPDDFIPSMSLMIKLAKEYKNANQN